MMQMRQEVIGSRRESSAGLGKGRRRGSAVLERGSGVVGSDRVRVIVGRDRKAMTSSEVVGSRNSSEHKERTFELLL